MKDMCKLASPREARRARDQPGVEVIRLLVVDDHSVVREGICSLLEREADMTVLGEAADGRDAISQVRVLRPHVVVMDIAMPELNGIDATARITELWPSVRIVILSEHTSVEFIHRALEAGARGYVFKRCTGEELKRAIRAVHKGGRYLTPPVTEKVIEGHLIQKSGSGTVSPLDRLSGREREVLQLLVEGHTAAAIAKVLSLAETSIHTYRKRVMEKLDVHNLPDLVRFAILHGLTPLE